MEGATPPTSFSRTGKNTRLCDMLQAKYHDVDLLYSGVVISKSSVPFSVPMEIKVVCNEKKITGKGNIKGKCEECILCETTEMQPHTIKYMPKANRMELINFINISNEKRNNIVRTELGYPGTNSCRQVKIEYGMYINIEEITVESDIEIIERDEEVVTIPALVIGDRLDINSRYWFSGTKANDPSDQSSIAISNKTQNRGDSVSNWDHNEEWKQRLEIFKPVSDSLQDIKDKIKEFQNDMAKNVTKIRDRDAIIMAADLVYHSVLKFSMGGVDVTKGWLEAAVIGDTRVGKTETISRLIKHYRAGEYSSSGENATLPGLLGGLRSEGKKYILTCVKLPQNDRKLLAIDEADTLNEKGIMGHLSGPRSSGRATITKIISRETNARTRIIWIANPPDGETVDSYAYGVEIVASIFGDKQDIARVDIATIASRSDIDLDVLNTQDDEIVEHKYTSDLCHGRVMFAWTRKPEDIVIESETVTCLNDMAKTLGAKYSDRIPLINGTEVKYKLARMAVSLAIMLYSVDDSGEKVIVRPVHAMVVFDWLQHQYDNPRMGYDDYSSQNRMDDTMPHEGDVKDIIKDIDILEAVYRTHYLDRKSVANAFNLKLEGDSSDKIRILRKNNCLIDKGNNKYIKSKLFLKYLRQRRKELNGTQRYEPNRW